MLGLVEQAILQRRAGQVRPQQFARVDVVLETPGRLTIDHCRTEDQRQAQGLQETTERHRRQPVLQARLLGRQQAECIDRRPADRAGLGLGEGQAGRIDPAQTVGIGMVLVLVPDQQQQDQPTADPRLILGGIAAAVADPGRLPGGPAHGHRQVETLQFLQKASAPDQHLADILQGEHGSTLLVHPQHQPLTQILQDPGHPVGGLHQQVLATLALVEVGPFQRQRRPGQPGQQVPTFRLGQDAQHEITAATADREVVHRPLRIVQRPAHHGIAGEHEAHPAGVVAGTQAQQQARLVQHQAIDLVDQQHRPTAGPARRLLEAVEHLLDPRDRVAGAHPSGGLRSARPGIGSERRRQQIDERLGGVAALAVDHHAVDIVATAGLMQHLVEQAGLADLPGAQDQEAAPTQAGGDLGPDRLAPDEQRAARRQAAGLDEG